MFPARQADRPRNRDWLTHVWRRVRAGAGLSDLRIHDLRHAYATFALRRGESVLAIGRLLGHADPQTTLKYTHLAHYKSSTRSGVHYSLVNQLLPTFGSTPLDRITRNQVLLWFDAYSQTAPGGANYAFGILHRILNFAVACGHLDATPTRGIRTNRRRALTRFLSRDEVRRLHRALDEHASKGASQSQQADIIRLLLLTGCRKSEVLTLRWSEVHEDALVLDDSKTGRGTVALNTRARRILDRQPRERSEFVFPSLRNPKRARARDLSLWCALRRDARIEDVRLHDLRHTVASHAVTNGVPIPVVSRLLGHANVRMTLRYAHVSDRETEAAAERVGTAIARIMALEWHEHE